MSSPTRPRGMIAALEKGPGPARYVLPTQSSYSGHDPTKRRNPAYSLAGRLPYTFLTKSMSPGPATTSLPTGITRYGRDGQPQWSMKSRLAPARDFTNAPAPCTYNPKLLSNMPSFSLAGRVSYHKQADIPASNTYSLPPALGTNLAMYKSTPGYSQRGRCLFGSYDRDYAKTPGPAKYMPIDQDLYLKGRPKFTLLGRVHYVEPKPQAPPPGTYFPECVIIDKPIAPHFSFGQKHSEFVTPVTFEVDVCS